VKPQLMSHQETFPMENTNQTVKNESKDSFNIIINNQPRYVSRLEMEMEPEFGSYKYLMEKDSLFMNRKGDYTLSFDYLKKLSSEDIMKLDADKKDECLPKYIPLNKAGQIHMSLVQKRDESGSNEVVVTRLHPIQNVMRKSCQNRRPIK